MNSSAEAYRQFLAGDDSALEKIISIYADGLMLYLNTFVKDIHVAEELTEEIFVKLVLKRPRIEKDYAFKTWLYTIAGNVARDHLRRGKNRFISLDECAELADLELLERSYIDREEKRLLHRAMGKLKTEYQQILWLLYFEDFSHREASTALGKTLHNTQVLASRARKALKNKMLEEGYVYEE